MSKSLTLKFSVAEAEALQEAIDMLHADYTTSPSTLDSTKKMLQASKRASRKLTRSLSGAKHTQKEWTIPGKNKVDLMED